MTRKTIAVDETALRTILNALVGPPHLIRELQAVTRIMGCDCPIQTLVTQFNAAIEPFPEPPKKDPEPTHKIQVRGALQTWEPLRPAFDLADGEYELYARKVSP